LCLFSSLIFSVPFIGNCVFGLCSRKLLTPTTFLAVTTNLVVNELLCYVQNNVSKHPRLLVRVAINGFYNNDEVTAAKLCLHGIPAASDVEGLPRLIRRQPGDNRRKLECEDIFALFAFADSAGCTLPTFVAANSYRLPSVIIIRHALGKNLIVNYQR